MSDAEKEEVHAEAREYVKLLMFTEAQWDKAVIAATANMTHGISNLAKKMQDQALTSAALRPGTEARQVYDEVMGLSDEEFYAKFPHVLEPDDEEEEDEDA